MREERPQRLKRELPDEEPMHTSQPSLHNQGNNNNRVYDWNSLPHGWLDCPPYGDEICCIIPSKVPLGESFNEYINSDKRYSSRQVIHQQRLLGRELGFVIDLTNTNRYYPKSDWTGKGIDYVKIRCRGRDAVPDDASVEKFVSEVLQFRSRQTHSNKYVLVHCTHGHNRTGYMIAHFLIRSESISVTEAIDKFARARHPGIYKQDYIDALYNFYHERKPEIVVCPRTPEWKRSSDLDCNGQTVPDQDDDGASSLHESVVRSEVITSDDVLGESVPPDQLQTMRQFCYEALKLSVRARGNMQFPGSHPVSLSRDNLQLLRQRYYYATWKADGTRYMMLITWDGCYLIDRNFYFRRVQIRFPYKSTNKGIAEKTHHYTLLDGEMIIDTEPNTQNQERRYLIYDLIAINQVSVMERPFSERWMILENEVIKPRNCERDFLYQSRDPYYRYDLEPFRVRRKDFYLLSTVTKLLREFIPSLSHAADGLILQGWDDPYVPRTHEGLLKWKYPEMNSVDFLFEVGADKRPLLFLHERGKKKLMEGNRVVFKDASDFSYSGKIIECSWDSEGGVWVCMRIRPDKSTPNEFNTYKKVMRSIRDNITEDVLLNEIHEIIRLPMYADRIRNDCRAFTSSARRK
uniref:mRNA guanylyltransferase n=1 Tax=Davidia involucrata TaxID=16924 RepID=A0A5B6Z318_DAVIN